MKTAWLATLEAIMMVSTRGITSGHTASKTEAGRINHKHTQRVKGSEMTLDAWRVTGHSQHWAGSLSLAQTFQHQMLQPTRDFAQNISNSSFIVIAKYINYQKKLVEL